MNSTARQVRRVILHYHLFKNAGTSVDEMLRRNFRKGWTSREFEGSSPQRNASKVRDWILEEEECVAYSSHTAMLPPPDIEGVEIFPIVFVRHPIDRIASAYQFEKKQKSSNFGAVLARNTNLAGYIQVRLALPHDRQCRNFQVARLCSMVGAAVGDETARAVKSIAKLPFVGLVEEYDQSIRALADWLAPYFPRFEPASFTKNVTRDHSLSLQERLKAIRTEVGESLYSELMRANEGDMKVFRTVLSRYSRALGSCSA